MQKEISSYISEYGKELSRLCSSLCKNTQDAEDLYQITWEKVISSIDKYDTSRPFDKWLWSVCVNAHRDMMKTPFRRRVIPFETEEALSRRLSTIADKSHELDEYISLHKAINKLSVPKRQVVALYYFKDLQISDISEILKIPEGTVKSRLSQAREQIRKELFHD